MPFQLEPPHDNIPRTAPSDDPKYRRAWTRPRAGSTAATPGRLEPLGPTPRGTVMMASVDRVPVFSKSTLAYCVLFPFLRVTLRLAFLVSRYSQDSLFQFRETCRVLSKPLSGSGPGPGSESRLSRPRRLSW